MTRDTDLTTQEKRAITALQRVASKWPDSLSLFSMSGSLYVVPTEDKRADTTTSRRAVPIFGIENDGGDPDDSPEGDIEWDWTPTGAGA